MDSPTKPTMSERSSPLPSPVPARGMFPRPPSPSGAHRSPRAQRPLTLRPILLTLFVQWAFAVSAAVLYGFAAGGVRPGGAYQSSDWLLGVVLHFGVAVAAALSFAVVAWEARPGAAGKPAGAWATARAYVAGEGVHAACAWALAAYLAFAKGGPEFGRRGAGVNFSMTMVCLTGHLLYLMTSFRQARVNLSTWTIETVAPAGGRIRLDDGA